ncbi:hypothetical protein, partial [Bifidobacterium cuniculi]
YQQWWVWLIAALVVIAVVVGIVLAVNGGAGSNGASREGNSSAITEGDSGSEKGDSTLTEDNSALKEMAATCKSQTSLGTSADCSVSGNTITVTVSMEDDRLTSQGDAVAASMARIMWKIIHDEKNIDDFEVKVIYKSNGKVVGEGAATSADSTGSGTLDSYQDMLDKYGLDSDTGSGLRGTY